MDQSPADFAAAWIDAWNSKDLEALLSHYQDDVVFTSPRAAAATGSSVLEGRDALRDYWGAAIARTPQRRFTLERVIWDAEQSELVIVYINDTGESRVRACEFFRFAPDGLVARGEAMYGPSAE